MDIRIIKSNVIYCDVCKDVRELKESWDEGQASLVENGEQEETKPFPGVPGYIIKDADDYKYSHNEICENCMKTLIKGVNLITSQNLTGISICNGNK
jgi:hypothetical protein